MQVKIKTVISCFIFLVGITVGGQAQHPTREIIWDGRVSKVFTDHVIVRLKPELNQDEFISLAEQRSIELMRPFNRYGTSMVRIDVEADYYLQIEELRNSGLFVDVDPSGVLEPAFAPNDTYYSSAQNYLHQIYAPFAWDITVGSSGVLVGIIDSGIAIESGTTNLSHEDLQNDQRITQGNDYSPESMGVRDSLGHGTAVTGVVSAETNNSNGIAGVSWVSELYINKILGTNSSGAPADLYDAVVDAVDTGVDIINLSLGATTNDSYFEDLADYAETHDVLLVIAVGDDGNNPVRYPAALSLEYDNIISVAGVDGNDDRWSQSNVGEEVTITALATGVFTTMPDYNVCMTDGNCFQPPFSQDYALVPGTSFSAPQVTGVAALMLSVNSSLTPFDIWEILTNTADKVPEMGMDDFTEEHGYGRLNAYEAVKHAIDNQLGSHTFSSNFTGRAHIYGNSSINSGVKLTVPSGKAIVLGTNSSIEGSSGSEIEISGTLIIDEGADVEDVTIDIKSSGKLIIRDNVEFDLGSSHSLIVGNSTPIEIGNDIQISGGNLEVLDGAEVTISGNLLETDITVDSGGELIIDEGTVLDFASGQGLTISGVVDIRGSSGDEITMQKSGGSNWNGIYLSGNDTNGSVIEHLDISGADYGIRMQNVGGGITLENVEATNNDIGLYMVSSGGVTVHNSEFSSQDNEGIIIDGSSAQFLDGIKAVGNDTGILVDNGAWIDIGDFDEDALADLRLNNIGLDVDDGSIVAMGELSGSPPGTPQCSPSKNYSDYFGGCSNLYSNSTYNVRAQGSSEVSAELTWWGTGTGPNNNSVSGGSTLEDDHHLGSSADVPFMLIPDDRVPLAPSPETSILAKAFSTVDDNWPNVGRFVRYIYDVKEKDGDSRVFTELERYQTHYNPLIAKWAGFLQLRFHMLREEYQTAIELGTGFLERKGVTDEDRAYVGRHLFFAHLYGTGDTHKAEELLGSLRVWGSRDALSGWLDKEFERVNSWEASPRAPLASADYSYGDSDLGMIYYPNPFRSQTTMEYTLPENGHVTIAVYDVLGREVVTVVDKQMEAGTHDTIFDGSSLSSGMYLCRIDLRPDDIVSSPQRLTVQMVMVK